MSNMFAFIMTQQWRADRKQNGREGGHDGPCRVGIRTRDACLYSKT